MNPTAAEDRAQTPRLGAVSVIAGAQLPDQASSVSSHVLSGAASSAASKSAVYQIDEIRREAIPFKKVIQFSRSEESGQAKVETWGKSGVAEKTYRVTYRGQKPVAFDLRHTDVIRKPIDTVISAGYSVRGARQLPSRSGTYTRTREIDMIATGYSPYEGSGQGICKTGIRAGLGVVAIDPRIIPLGSKLYIDGYGYALAGDTGGAIHGNRIDLGLNSRHLATMVGRRVVHVYVMSEGR
jgi:3D (Asp-Asp-Asp) domain-containing protein